MKRSGWLTKGLLSPLTLPLLIVAPGLLCPAPAGAAETLDQSQTLSQSPTTVSYNVPKAQIFTAGQFGWLARVRLRLENYTSSPPAGAVLTVSVQTVIGGLPTGKQIGSGTIPLSAIPSLGNPGWADVSIHGALMLAGTQYALVLQTSNLFGSVTWWYAYQSYAAGAMAHNYGNGWITDENYDFTFQTYVIPDALDQWQSGHDIYAGGNRWGSQTFTAGLSGVLDRVRVYLSWGGMNSTTGISATIFTASGTVIGQGSAGPSSVPVWAPGGWVNIGINGAVVTAGTQYSVVLSANNNFLWYYTWTAPGTTTYAFETYVAEPIMFSPPPPPPATTTPCSSGVCPAVTGSIAPKDSTARVTSLVHFQELRDGTVHGILNFNDSRTGNLVLQGCTTESAACGLTVTRLTCTDQHAITIEGAYTPKGETASGYRLTLSGTRDGIGTFTLTAGNYTYTLTLKGIVDVTCPPVAGVVEGQR